jgi:hypothetical protein
VKLHHGALDVSLLLDVGINENPRHRVYPAVLDAAYRFAGLTNVFRQAHYLRFILSSLDDIIKMENTNTLNRETLSNLKRELSAYERSDSFTEKGYTDRLKAMDELASRRPRSTLLCLAVVTRARVLSNLISMAMEIRTVYASLSAAYHPIIVDCVVFVINAPPLLHPDPVCPRCQVPRRPARLEQCVQCSLAAVHIDIALPSSSLETIFEFLLDKQDVTHTLTAAVAALADEPP